MFVNARSLLRFDRRTKFANAVTTCRYPTVIVTENWWNEVIEDSEFMLFAYILLRCERAVNKHGGVLVALQSIISAKLISDDLPDGCILTIVDIQLKKFLVCVIYNHPLGSAYRYTLADFEQVLRVIEEFKQYACLISGDFNLPKVNWSINHTSDNCLTFQITNRYKYLLKNTENNAKPLSSIISAFATPITMPCGKK